jgi:hypothetical protein
MFCSLSGMQARQAGLLRAGQLEQNDLNSLQPTYNNCRLGTRGLIYHSCTKENYHWSFFCTALASKTCTCDLCTRPLIWKLLLLPYHASGCVFCLVM